MKHLRVLSCGCLHLDFVNKLKRNVASNDIIICDKSTLESIDNKISVVPLFSEKIVVEVYVDLVTKDLLKLLHDYMTRYTYVQFIIITTRMSDYKKFDKMVENKLMLSFNMYLVDKDYVKNYIYTRLSNGRNLTSYVDAIYSKVSGNLAVLDDYISVVNNYKGKLSTAMINRILPKAGFVGIDSAFNNMLLGRDQKGTMRFLIQFRLGYRWVYTEFLERFELLLKYHDKYLSGEFNRLNIKEYVGSGVCKDVGGKLYTYLEIYENYSYGYIFKAYMKFSKLTKSSLAIDTFVLSMYGGSLK